MHSRRFFLQTLVLGTPALLHGQASPHRIPIGQIGTEHAHASGKFEAIRHLSQLYDVIGLATRTPPSNPVYAGLPLFSESDLLALPHLQAVTIETRIEDASAMALLAIRAGKHVHLDKPGAIDHAAFTEMRLEAERRGLIVQMGYMLRVNPAFRWLFQAVRDGWLGEILEIDASMGKLADEKTRATIGALDGGGMFELACHLIDAVITLLGKPAEVVARSTPSRSDQVKDNQIALLLYPRTSVSIRCNHTDPFGNPKRRFQLTGTEGTVEIHPLESGEFTLSLKHPRGPWKSGTQRVKLPLPRARYDEEFIQLARLIRGEAPNPWNAAHDIAVHETVLKASGLPL